MDTTAYARFMEKVDITPECWLWTAATDHGYGKFWLEGRFHMAHRAHYEHFHGTVEGGTIDHLCRVPRCVRLDHLEHVSVGENFRRGVGRAGRWRNTHCAHGHEFTPENTYVKPNGTRNCKACREAAMERYYAKWGRRSGPRGV